MELHQHLYSVSELAEKVGVPRTTITDWLAKYERFIDSRIQGKRRFYTTRSLDVLKKIAELRSTGHSLIDIDIELEHSFAILPTVESETVESVKQTTDQNVPLTAETDSPESTFSANTSESEHVAGPQTTDSVSEESIPSSSEEAAAESFAVVKQDADVADLVNAKFVDLCRSMEEMNRKNEKSGKRLKFVSAFSIMLVVLVIAVIILTYINFSLIHERSRDFSDTLNKQENTLNTGVDHITNQIGTAVGDFSDELELVKAQLKKQQDEFDAEVSRQMKLYEQGLASKEEMFETKIALQKELFAEERLKLLQRCEKLEQEKETLFGNDSDRTLKLKEATDELTRKDLRIQELQDKLAALEKNLQMQKTEHAQKEELLNRQVKTADGVRTVALQRAEKAEGENERLKKELADLQQKLQQQNNAGVQQ